MTEKKRCSRIPSHPSDSVSESKPQLFHPVTEELGREGRRRAAEAARRILEHLDELQHSPEKAADSEPSPDGSNTGGRESSGGTSSPEDREF